MGDGVRRADLCGREGLRKIYTAKRSMEVIFKTDSSETHSGFYAVVNVGKHIVYHL